MAENIDRRAGVGHGRALPSRTERQIGGARSPITGRLQRFGSAPYQFRRGAEQSYFLELIVLGKQKRIWGKDLERAIVEAETKPKVGDVVGVQLVSRRAVMVTARTLDTLGRVIAQTERQPHRNEWRVEKVQYFSARARAARRARDDQQDRARALAERPELKSTFLTMRAAEKLAEQRIANSADRQRFLELIKEAIDSSVRKNEPLPEVRLKERSKVSQTAAPAGPPRKPDDPVR